MNTPILAALVLATTAAAQSPTVDVTTTTYVGIHSESPPLAPQTQGLPAGTPIGAGFAWSTTSGQCETALAILVQDAMVAIQGSGQAGGAAQPPGVCGITDSPASPPVQWVDLRLNFTAPQPTSGTLIVDSYTWALALFSGSAFSGFRLDVDQTQILDLSSYVAPTHHEIPITIGPSGKAVDIGLFGGSHSSGPTLHDYTMDVTIEFVPDCTFESHGQGAASLTAGVDGTTLHLGLDSSLPDAQGVLFVGLQTTQIPTPFGDLLVDSLVSLGPNPLDGDGDFALAAGLPSLPTFALQGGAVDFANGAVELSNALTIDCP